MQVKEVNAWNQKHTRMQSKYSDSPHKETPSAYNLKSRNARMPAKLQQNKAFVHHHHHSFYYYYHGYMLGLCIHAHTHKSISMASLTCT